MDWLENHLEDVNPIIRCKLTDKLENSAGSRPTFARGVSFQEYELIRRHAMCVAVLFASDKIVWGERSLRNGANSVSLGGLNPIVLTRKR